MHHYGVVCQQDCTPCSQWRCMPAGLHAMQSMALCANRTARHAVNGVVCQQDCTPCSLWRCVPAGLHAMQSMALCASRTARHAVNGIVCQQDCVPCSQWYRVPAGLRYAVNGHVACFNGHDFTKRAKGHVDGKVNFANLSSHKRGKNGF